jgi:hypothetical protein
MAFAIAIKIIVASAYRIVRKTKGSAYGSMYFAPTKPVLQSAVKSIGAPRDNLFT